MNFSLLRHAPNGTRIIWFLMQIEHELNKCEIILVTALLNIISLQVIYVIMVLLQAAYRIKTAKFIGVQVISSS